MSCEEEDDQCRQLLRSLKSTAEGLLASHTANVWSVYGGLGRMHAAVLKILQHGLRIYTPKGEPDCWSFVEALQWLQPSLAISPPFRPPLHNAAATSSCSSSPDDAQYNRYSDWLYRSLETHSLSGKLSWLLSDANHLENCYTTGAFLRRQRYAEAALICLRAVEQGQPSLLTDLDPRLYLSQWTSKHFVRSHRRCSSFPDNMRPGCAPSSSKQGRKAREARRATTIPHIKAQLSCPSPLITTRGIFRQWTSEPNLLKSTLSSDIKVRSRGRSATTTAIQRHKMSASRQHKIKSLLNVNYIDIQKTSQEKLNSINKEKVDEEEALTRNYVLIEEPRDSIELASEASEEVYAKLEVTDPSEKVSSPQELEQSESINLSESVSQIVLDDATNESSCSSLPTSPLEISIKRPTDLSLSLTTDGDRPYNTASVRRASDTAVGLHERSESINRDVTDTMKTSLQLYPQNHSIETENLSITTDSQKTETSNPVQEDTVSELSKEKTGHHRKMPSDPVFLSAIVSGLTPPRVTPSYTPSSSMSLSPPFLPLAIPGAPFNIALSQRNLETNSFIASAGRFSDPAEELGRENAHFSVSEAMIAAIERAKCERSDRGLMKSRNSLASTQAEDTLNSEEEDDPEIAHLKERIRVRRREKEQREKRRQQARMRRVLRVKRPPLSQTLQSDGRTDTATPNTTTATDVSDPSSSLSPSSLDSEPDDSSRDIPVNPTLSGAPTDNLARLRDAGLSVSLASLYSESELAAKQAASRIEESGTSAKWSRSAEGVAWGLLRQFSDRALPRDCELQWLVSEQDAPQQLLPLPSSWPVSPDEAEDEDMSRATPLRGTLQWAPPRAQIIFTPHPRPNRKVLLANQNYMCAGCGMKVEPQYANKFRYCEYLGRYFCTGCHGNQLAVIPGKVLDKWDFTRCPVSNFSYRLLEQMQSDALFRVEDLNPSLFRKSRKLAKCKLARIQVSQLRDFVINCRFATQLHTLYRHEPPHLTTDAELYSLKDLIDVHTGDLQTRLQELITASTNHVTKCELCTARGFVCELCHSCDIIFPWDVTRVVRCQHCGCCLHLACWKGSHTPATSPSMATPDDCPRCLRMKARHQSQTEE